MISATRVRPAGSWNDKPTDTVVLDFDDRHRRRTVMNGVQGLTLLLDLPEAVMLRGGDALELEDGRLVEVVASPEPLIEVKARVPGELARLAWHIGNRHLPAQITANAIRLRQDHVIEEMLTGLGAKLVAIEAPFDPEGGAYASSGSAQHAAADHAGHGSEHHHHSSHDHGGKHGKQGHKHDDHKQGHHEHGHHKHGDHKHDH